MSYLEIHKKEVLGIFRIEEESVREDGDFPFLCPSSSVTFMFHLCIKSIF